jgi:hypothetical protein
MSTTWHCIGLSDVVVSSLEREIARDCPIPEVGESAIVLLKTLHQNISSKIKSKYAGVIRDQYLQTCLVHLSNALKKESDSSRLVVKRCVFLLKVRIHVRSVSSSPYQTISFTLIMISSTPSSD